MTLIINIRCGNRPRINNHTRTRKNIYTVWQPWLTSMSKHSNKNAPCENRDYKESHILFSQTKPIHTKTHSLSHYSFLLQIYLTHIKEISIQLTLFFSNQVLENESLKIRQP